MGLGMKVLVTGANGLLGANLIRELIQANLDVKAFVRPSADIRNLQGVPCQICRGDIKSYEDIYHGLIDCDAVVHAASSTDIRPLGAGYFEKINVEPTKHIAHAVLQQGNKRLVFVGTANAFGPGSRERPGSETSPFNLGHYRSGYIDSKHKAQQHILDRVKRDGLDAVIVNPTFMIGPYDTKPSSGKIILQGLRHGVQWCPPGGKNFVPVRDVANGIYKALINGRPGECYLLAGGNLTYREFFLQLNEVAGRKRVPVVIPKKIVRLAGTIAEGWSAMTDQKLPFNKTNAHLLSLDNYYTPDKADRDLHMRHTSIKKAIEEALEWFKKEHYITEDNYSVQGTNFDL